jgi:hypothetical protein
VGQRRGRPLGLLGALLLGLVASGVYAQTTGAIAGRAADSSGVPLPGVTIEASSSHLQGTRVAVTGSDGSYRLPALPPGIYALRASLSGLTGVEKTATVMLDTTSIVNMTLQLSLREEVLVSGETLRIDTTSTTTGTSYTDNVIAHLPVDRNYADIVRSNPAVGTDRGDTQGRALGLTIYGATSAENQWIIDGVNTTNVFKGLQGKAINNEFVQEVEVKTGGYQAEYGRALGGVVNVITKSGGNAFHGDGFVYYDSSGTSARQVFTAQDSLVAGMRLADYNQFDYGVDLGGYLLKDKLWFFAAYDRVGFSGNVSRIESSQFVSKDARFPLEATDNLYSGKLTWNVASSTSLVFTVFADPSTKFGAAGADPREEQASLQAVPILNSDPSTWSSARRFGGADYGLRATQLLASRGLLTLQASQHRDRNLLTAANTIRYEDWSCDPSEPPGTLTVPCTPPATPNFVWGGYGWIDGNLGHNVSQRNQFRGDVTLYAGSHELKVGGDYQDGKSDMIYSCTGGQCVQVRNDYGQAYYVHTFSARSGSDLTELSDGRFHAQVRGASAYLQDSWKPAAGLTVNLGLRWDGEYLRNYYGATVLRLTNEWQPRVGVAWDPGKDGRTKLYAFAGRFYYGLPTSAMTWWFGNVTGVDTYNLDPGAITPDPSVLGPGGYGQLVWFGGSPWITPVDRGLRETYQDEYTVGAERLLDPTFTVGLKATYRRLGNAIEDRCDFDAGRPETSYSSCAIINPGSNGKFARGDAPTCNGFDDNQCADSGPATPPARRLYRGIELLARKSLGDKLWLQASYVYSSLRGNYDGAINQSHLESTPGDNSDFNFPALWRNAYGRLFLDRPHRFRLDGYWVSPWRIAVGLQGFVESGAPFNKLGYFSGNYDPAIYLVNRGSAGRLPTQWEANLTLSYPIAVGPATVTLQAYAFNLFSNQIGTAVDEKWSLAQPSGSVFDSNQSSTNPEYGKFTSRQTPRFFRAAVRVSF